jgi:hypothetical protein
MSRALARQVVDCLAKASMFLAEPSASEADDRSAEC